MFLAMPMKERGTQASVDVQDKKSQTYGISQHNPLPPFLYMDVAEDAGVRHFDFFFIVVYHKFVTFFIALHKFVYPF